MCYFLGSKRKQMHGKAKTSLAFRAVAHCYLFFSKVKFPFSQFLLTETDIE